MVVVSYPLFYTDFKKPRLRNGKPTRSIRGCWFVLLFRTLPPAAPPALPVAPLRGMIGRVLYTAAVTLPAGPHTDIQCRNRKRHNNRSNRQRRREDIANDLNS